MCVRYQWLNTLVHLHPSLGKKKIVLQPIINSVIPNIENFIVLNSLECKTSSSSVFNAFQDSGRQSYTYIHRTSTSTLRYENFWSIENFKRLPHSAIMFPIFVGMCSSTTWNVGTSWKLNNVVQLMEAKFMLSLSLGARYSFAQAAFSTSTAKLLSIWHFYFYLPVLIRGQMNFGMKIHSH